MEKIFSVVVGVILMLADVHCKYGGIPAKIGKKLDARLNCSIVSIEEVAEELTILGNQTKACNIKLTILTKNFTKICKVVENLGKPEVDITRSNESSRTLRVDVTDGYVPCVDQLRGHCSDLNAKIWCLRVGLWRVPLFNSTRDDIAEQRLFGVNLRPGKSDEKSTKRFKRGTRKLTRIAPDDITKPNSGFRIRKEYRTLTVDERNRYHTAVQELYKDKTFRCFARVHQKGIKLKGVHKGEAFLPWHRAFLALYEEALRQIDSNVSLPYWDSTIDDNMASPSLSVMWDDEHMGTGHGEVDDGPFAGFVTDSSPLKRDIANGRGKLVRQKKINDILKNCRMGDMFKMLEGVHNGVHIWISGTMKGTLSASDPIFYMHHAFIDLIWEEFRKGQNSSKCGFIDPSNDYPVTIVNGTDNGDDSDKVKPTPEGHMPDEEMDGMEFMLNRLGIENFWTRNWYNYEERPSCANNCGNSEDMVCDEEVGVCVSKQAEDAGENDEFQEPPQMIMQPPPPPPDDINTTDSEVKIRESCRTNPYQSICPNRPTLRGHVDRASAYVNGDIELPSKVANIELKVQQQIDRVYDTPPVSEPVFFHEVVENDCRTINTAVYDIVTAMIQGKRIPSKKRQRNVQ